MERRASPWLERLGIPGSYSNYFINPCWKSWSSLAAAPALLQYAALQQQYVAASEEEYANDDDDQMDSWSEGTSPLPCDASHTSDEALPIKQFVRLQYSSDRVFRVLWQTRAAMQTRSAV